MSTQFTNRQWRLPNNENKDKQSNYSMDFDGSSQYIDTPQIDLGSTNSISFWINRSSTAQGTLFGDPNASSEYVLFTVPSTNNIYFRLGNGNSGYWELTVSSGLLNDGIWHHHCLTRDGVSLNYYIDGIPQTNVTNNTLNASAGTNTTIENIMAKSDGTLPLSGKLDGVSIFDYALTDGTGGTVNQIAALYGSSSTGIGNPMAISGGGKPVAYYNLGDKSAFNNSNYLIPNSSLKDYVFDFDGSNDYINLNFQSQTTPATISIWVNTDVNDSQQRYAIINGRADQQPAVYLRMQSDNTYQVFISNTNGFDTLQASSATVNTWFHFAIVCENSQTLLYENGVLKDSSTIGWNGIDIDQSNNWQLGRDSRGQRYWNGKISNTQIFNTALPATGSNSVETLYNNGSPLTSMSGFTSLQGWWKLDASATYDGTDWTIPDDSSNSNDGTSSGMTQANLVQSDLSFTSGYSPYALDFDAASSDYIQINNGSSLTNGFSQLTVSIWANFSGTGQQQIITKDGVSQRSFNLRRLSNGVNFLVSTDGTSNSQTLFYPSSSITIGKWYHFVGIYDGSKLLLYVNGSLIDDSVSLTGSLPNTTSGLYIGSYAYGNSTTFDGFLSNASIWNTALTSTQVTEIYNEGVPSNLNNHSAYSNLVSWWQLGSNTSWLDPYWIALDEKGTNNGQSQNVAAPNNMGENAIVDGVGSYANGVGTSGLEVIGSAPFSDANSLSVNMDVLDRSTDVPN